MARPTEFLEVEIKNFKGLDLRGPAELVPASSFQTLTNFEVGYAGELKKRPGFIRQHDGTTLGMVPLRLLGELSTSTWHHLLALSCTAGTVSGKVYYSNNSGVTWIQASTPAADVFWLGKGVQYNGMLHMPSAASGRIYIWTGSTWTYTGAGPPLCPTSINRPAILQDRMFVIDKAALSIKWSETLDFNAWPAGNVITYKTEDRDQPVGIIAYRDRLVILRQNSLQVLNVVGVPSSWSLKTLPFNIGVTNENCAVIYNDLLYLLAIDGVYRTDLTSIDELSKPLMPVFYQRRKLLFSVASSYSDAMGYWNGRLLCSMRTGTSEYRLFVYNIDTQTWSEWIPNIPSAPAGYPYAPFRDFLTVATGKRGAGIDPVTYTKEGLYACYIDNTGRVMLFDDQNLVYTDEAGGTYNAVARTRNINADNSEDLKRVYSMSVRGRKNSGTTLNGLFNVNGADGSTFTIPIGIVTKQGRFKGPGYFREAALEVSDNSSSYVEIESITAHAKRKSAITESRT